MTFSAPLTQHSRDMDFGPAYARTNKAEFYRLVDRSIVKRYDTPNARQRIERDRLSLETIGRQFGDVPFENWNYRIVKPLWFDLEQAMVCMEFADGVALADIPAEKVREWEFHSGVWLGLYHNKLFGGRKLGLVFSDYTVHNLLVDFEHQSVTAVDPGMQWETVGYSYEDVVRHVNSALAVLVTRCRSPIGAVLGFLEGYARSRQSRGRFREGCVAVARETWRELRDHARKSWIKCGLFAMLAPLLIPMHVMLLAWFLCRPSGSADKLS